jgi:hypothetical protein
MLGVLSPPPPHPPSRLFFMTVASLRSLQALHFRLFEKFASIYTGTARVARAETAGAATAE